MTARQQDALLILAGLSALLAVGTLAGRRLSITRTERVAPSQAAGAPTDTLHTSLPGAPAQERGASAAGLQPRPPAPEEIRRDQ